MDLSAFLPSGARILSLPSFKAPRLSIVDSTPSRRWRESAMYPAFRQSAQLYRLALRMKTACGLGQVWINQASCWELQSFVSELFPDLCSAVILQGTPGPAQKITVELWSNQEISGYVKYAESPVAISHLLNEYQMLTQLTNGLGPKVLKYGSWKNGVALVVTSLGGRPISIRSFPGEIFVKFLNDCIASPPISLEDHPWIQTQLKDSGQIIHSWLKPLAARKWPIVFQHGDFVPWNIRLMETGEIRAFDWEYGIPQGFPFLDMAYYFLQVSRLIYRTPSPLARDNAVRELSKWLGRELDEFQALSLVRLTAYWAYQQCLNDGHSIDAKAVQWWKAIWS